MPHFSKEEEHVAPPLPVDVDEDEKVQMHLLRFKKCHFLKSRRHFLLSVFLIDLDRNLSSDGGSPRGVPSKKRSVYKILKGVMQQWKNHQIRSFLRHIISSKLCDIQYLFASKPQYENKKFSKERGCHLSPETTTLSLNPAKIKTNYLIVKFLNDMQLVENFTKDATMLHPLHLT